MEVDKVLIDLKAHPIFKKKRMILDKTDITMYFGLTKRTVQLYTDMGLIIPGVSNPSGRGKKRLYSIINYYQFQVIAELKKAGVSLNIIKGYLDKYRHDTARLIRVSRKVARWQNRINNIDI